MVCRFQQQITLKTQKNRRTNTNSEQVFQSKNEANSEGTDVATRLYYVTQLEQQHKK